MSIKMHRPENRLDRSEYLVRAHEFAKRGEELPQTKLDQAMLDDIKSAIKQRDNLRKHIANNLSNEGLARRFGVHRRTIERAIHENRL
jgi:transcriptional regulator GlxA family with amidase domain